MPIIDVQPLVMKDVTLIIDTDGDDYKQHVDGVTFTPSSSVTTWTGLGSNTHTDSATATWTLDLSYVQDWETVDSLSAFLLEHEGETMTVQFHPKSGSGPSFTSDVTITPGAIGGTVNAFATTTTSLGSTKPQLIPAAP
jgi:hypothetical protein